MKQYHQIQIPTLDKDEAITDDLRRRICALEDLPAEWARKPYIESGYRLNMGFSGSIRSVLDKSHNDFYEIWSDLVPLIVFLAIAFSQVSSGRFHSQCDYAKLLECGVYIGVITCRGLSGIYHIFNCCDIWSNKRMIYVDQIGITSMALVSPYFYALAQDHRSVCTASESESFTTYTILLMSVALLSYMTFISALVLESDDWVVAAREPLLVTLAGIGNWAAIAVMIDGSKPTLLRTLCGSGCVVLILGYLFFFTLRIPDRFLRAGTVDFKFWSSHVMWHYAVGISQLLYIVVPYFYHD